MSLWWKPGSWRDPCSKPTCSRPLNRGFRGARRPPLRQAGRPPLRMNGSRRGTFSKIWTRIGHQKSGREGWSGRPASGPGGYQGQRPLPCQPGPKAQVSGFPGIQGLKARRAYLRVVDERSKHRRVLDRIHRMDRMLRIPSGTAFHPVHRVHPVKKRAVSTDNTETRPSPDHPGEGAWNSWRESPRPGLNPFSGRHPRLTPWARVFAPLRGWWRGRVDGRTC